MISDDILSHVETKTPRGPRGRPGNVWQMISVYRSSETREKRKLSAARGSAGSGITATNKEKPGN